MSGQIKIEKVGNKKAVMQRLETSLREFITPEEMDEKDKMRGDILLIRKGFPTSRITVYGNVMTVETKTQLFSGPIRDMMHLLCEGHVDHLSMVKGNEKLCRIYQVGTFLSKGERIIFLNWNKVMSVPELFNNIIDFLDKANRKAIIISYVGKRMLGQMLRKIDELKKNIKFCQVISHFVLTNKKETATIIRHFSIHFNATPCLFVGDDKKNCDTVLKKISSTYVVHLPNLTRKRKKLPTTLNIKKVEQITSIPDLIACLKIVG